MSARTRRRIVVGTLVAVTGLAVAVFAGMQVPGWRPPFDSMRGGCWGGAWPVSRGTGSRISDAEILEIADEYVGVYATDGLEIAEIMLFDNHAYVEVKETGTGTYAFEFLIDPFTGSATPEPGPNMMWNEKYGHMAGGMMGMGRFFAPRTSDDEMAVSPEEAVSLAQAYLDRRSPELEVDDHAAAFHGYYTLHTLRNGKTHGMLSVHGTTGDVWIHTWHGEFLGHLEADGH